MGVPEPVWIEHLSISSDTEDKLWSKHDLDPADVRRAVQRKPGLRGTWDDHPNKGLRMLIKVKIGTADVLVVLYPDKNNEQRFILGSAFKSDR